MSTKINAKIQNEKENCYNDDMAKIVNTSSFTFEFLRRENVLYVDKTKWLYKLIRENSRVFLSRPRRFGKSLTLSTLEAIFQGRKELFEGLYISQTNYDWKKYPVIKISFGSCGSQDGESLNRYLNNELEHIIENFNSEVELENDSSVNFRNLIARLAEQEKVVILVDEYEKVITDNIFNPNIEGLKNTLSQFYQVLKDQDDKIRFVFITGVTKYTKLSIFSKMNNIRDISMDKAYADMLGYTQEELESYFAEHIDEAIAEYGFDRTEYLRKIKDTYDGYKFHPRAKGVYNPVSVGLFFATGGEEFRSFWSETGGMQLLMDVAKKVDFNILDDVTSPVSLDILQYFDIIRLNSTELSKDDVKILLWQTGYLTIKERGDVDGTLILDFPNMEVSRSYILGLLRANKIGSIGELFYTNGSFKEGILTRDLDRAMKAIISFFASIPYNASAFEDKKEHFWQIVFYSFVRGVGFSTSILENATNNGRIDLSIETHDGVFIFEFKLDGSVDEALAQIENKGYTEKYLSSNKKIYLIGINFSKEKRNIEEWKVKVL